MIANIGKSRICQKEQQKLLGVKFENLSDLYNSVSIHHRNTRSLPIELYKVKHNLPIQVMS